MQQFANKAIKTFAQSTCKSPHKHRAVFAFQGKHFATIAEDKYWIDVTVASKPRPWTLTILHLMGVKLYFHWVVIESGLDNKVRTVF